MLVFKHFFLSLQGKKKKKEIMDKMFLKKEKSFGIKESSKVFEEERFL